jgi:hypothetical protein
MSGEAPGGPAPGPFDHQPLPAPRHPALVFTPVGVELDRLFFESLFRGADTAVDGARIARGPAPDGNGPLGFPRHDADGIVSDEHGNQDAEVVFDDALIPKQAPEIATLDLESFFLPLCPTLPSQNCMNRDDFTRVVSTTTVVPEPASASLLAMGLALLASRRRR